SAHHVEVSAAGGAQDGGRLFAVDGVLVGAVGEGGSDALQVAGGSRVQVALVDDGAHRVVSFSRVNGFRVGVCDGAEGVCDGAAAVRAVASSSSARRMPVSRSAPELCPMARIRAAASRSACTSSAARALTRPCMLW